MIRRFRREDLPRILEIERDAFPKSAYSRYTFLYYAKTIPDNFLVYEDDESGEVQGYVLFDDDGHIISIAVAREHRRRGIGTSLVRAVLRSSGGRAFVEVRESNIGAQRFYEKLGFRRVGRAPGYYEDEDAILMELVASPSLPC
ncbi:MAG: ribosomal-protein-alanine N-acetyltransferase [Candidatus Alkanophagales archaeon]|nr:MAG: ribosomal-protein-alanine N-acetyltransferase [Candidatus Alkanophagales archaeon]